MADNKNSVTIGTNPFEGIKPIEITIKPQVRAALPDHGEWTNEPDAVLWTDSATGLLCAARRSTLGTWCGYVAVPSSHPWAGIEYNGDDSKPYGERGFEPQNAVDVHGGLTFSGTLAFGGMWSFGFDCAHLYDARPGERGINGCYRDIGFVIRHTLDMARQIKDADRVEGQPEGWMVGHKSSNQVELFSNESDVRVLATMSDGTAVVALPTTGERNAVPAAAVEFALSTLKSLQEGAA